MTASVHNSPEITVLYFAGASTATGLTMERIPLPTRPASESTSSTPQHFPLSALAALLSARHPNTTLDAVLAQSSWAVNEEMVDDPETIFLRGGEEVAVICPVSGG